MNTNLQFVDLPYHCNFEYLSCVKPIVYTFKIKGIKLPLTSTILKISGHYL